MPQTMDDLLRQVEQDASLVGPPAKARMLADLIAPEHRHQAFLALASLCIRLRAGGEKRTPLRLAASPADERPTLTPAPSPKPAKPRHASPKQLAVGMAWKDLLASQLTLPNVGKIQVQDMSADQLVTAADALFDISEQLHDLARAVIAAGVDNARSLPDETLTAIGGAAEQAS